ncbi:MAG: sugar nucleotide-binding protein, partial [Candidatus Marinimicrobia bacterium]|nr:sugar nucleotide-binding protein [Candidatus Neomarinimicrobiota bacterium]
FELSGIQCSVSPITTEQYPTPAKRPKNTLMNKDKISHRFDIDILDWSKSLESCITILKEQQ